MAFGTATRASLLLRIRNPRDRIAWCEFVELYAPLIHSYGLRRGLQDADAADLVQEVLQSVSRVASEFDYDPAKGSFRGWLLAITRNAIRKLANQQRRYPMGSGDTQIHALLAEQPANDCDDEWERDYRWNLFHWAATRVQKEFRNTTWQAFWQSVVEHHSVEEVAAELGMSSGAVYIARSRVAARIREQVAMADGL